MNGWTKNKNCKQYNKIYINAQEQEKDVNIDSAASTERLNW